MYFSTGDNGTLPLRWLSKVATTTIRSACRMQRRVQSHTSGSASYTSHLQRSSRSASMRPSRGASKVFKEPLGAVAISLCEETWSVFPSLLNEDVRRAQASPMSTDASIGTIAIVAGSWLPPVSRPGLPSSASFALRCKMARGKSMASRCRSAGDTRQTSVSRRARTVAEYADRPRTQSNSPQRRPRTRLSMTRQCCRLPPPEPRVSLAPCSCSSRTRSLPESTTKKPLISSPLR
mmetsp:Transcript_71715/g.198976  ORF Transcript_71715/g.198976 Transcript_71715/m.198976 type:complete len:235 (+) Transcript_71715:1498-2202(+)